MKLFKKVMAVVLVGAMAVSMLTACGSTSKTTKVANALNNAGIATNKNAEMNADTNKAMSALQVATDGIEKDPDYLTNHASEISGQLTQMSDYTFATDTTNSKYALYIWTNNSVKRPGAGEGNYDYLYKVENYHVTTYLADLLDKDFVKKGEFKPTDANLTVLKKLLKDVENVSVSCEKVYGMDVLLVTVPKDANVSNSKLSA